MLPAAIIEAKLKIIANEAVYSYIQMVDSNITALTVILRQVGLQGIC
jgi:hypothetical protein